MDKDCPVAVVVEICDTMVRTRGLAGKYYARDIMYICDNNNNK